MSLPFLVVTDFATRDGFSGSVSLPFLVVTVFATRFDLMLPCLSSYSRSFWASFCRIAARFAFAGPPRGLERTSSAGTDAGRFVAAVRACCRFNAFILGGTALDRFGTLAISV